jgi:serine/threonine-protein kinase
MASHENDVLSHYKIHRHMGAGGMGEVNLATDTLLDPRVAVKLLPKEATSDPNRVRRFLQKQAASSLNHPHIITIHECSTNA